MGFQFNQEGRAGAMGCTEAGRKLRMPFSVAPHCPIASERYPEDVPSDDGMSIKISNGLDENPGKTASRQAMGCLEPKVGLLHEKKGHSSSRVIAALPA